MKSAVELHDSSVSSACVAAGVLELTLHPAYIHISAGTPGVDPGEGHLGTVTLLFLDANLVGELCKLHGRISDGDLVVHGISRSVVELPFAEVGRVSLSLILESGTAYFVEASSVQVTLVGPTRYVEQFAG